MFSINNCAIYSNNIEVVQNLQKKLNISKTDQIAEVLHFSWSIWCLKRNCILFSHSPTRKVLSNIDIKTTNGILMKNYFTECLLVNSNKFNHFSKLLERVRFHFYYIVFTSHLSESQLHLFDRFFFNLKLFRKLCTECLRFDGFTGYPQN